MSTVIRNLEVPNRYQKLYDKAIAGRSRRAAILAHCVMCMGWSRKQASECPAKSCPLWQYRPQKRSATRAILRQNRTPGV